MLPLSFIYEEKNALALITLNRTETLNSLTFEVYEELIEVMRNLKNRKDIHAIVISGKGRAFCSGGDFNDIVGRLFSDDQQSTRHFNQLTSQLFLHMKNLDKPIIGAINGIAAGDGASLALACDLRIASEKASFAFVHNNFALAGTGSGVSYLLPRVVGMGRALELLLTGETLSAYEAERYGLVNKVVAHEELLPQAIKYAQRFVNGPTLAVGLTKKLLYGEMDLELEKALEKEVEMQTLCMESSDFQEAYEAFIAKRKPKFIGK